MRNLFKSREQRTMDLIKARLDFLQAWTDLAKLAGDLSEEDRTKVQRELDATWEMFPKKFQS